MKTKFLSFFVSVLFIFQSGFFGPDPSVNSAVVDDSVPIYQNYSISTLNGDDLPPVHQKGSVNLASDDLPPVH